MEQILMFCSFQIQDNGVSSFRFKLEMKELIIPIVSAELEAIILPYILVIAQIQLLGKWEKLMSDL